MADTPDIVERLGVVQAALDKEGSLTITQASDFWIADAAAEITRLRSVNAALLEALEAFVALDDCEAHFEDGFERALPAARTALALARKERT